MHSLRLWMELLVHTQAQHAFTWWSRMHSLRLWKELLVHTQAQHAFTWWSRIHLYTQNSECVQNACRTSTLYNKSKKYICITQKINGVCFVQCVCMLCVSGGCRVGLHLSKPLCLSCSVNSCSQLKKCQAQTTVSDSGLDPATARYRRGGLKRCL